MTNETNKVLVKIREEFTNGYWDSDDAQRYVPMLFAFIEPDDNVRQSLKALSCKKEKDQRYRQGNSAMESGRDFHCAFREIEHLLERYEERYRKRSPEGEAREETVTHWGQPPRYNREASLKPTPYIFEPLATLRCHSRPVPRDIFPEFGVVRLQ